MPEDETGKTETMEHRRKEQRKKIVATVRPLGGRGVARQGGEPFIRLVGYVKRAQGSKGLRKETGPYLGGRGARGKSQLQRVAHRRRLLRGGHGKKGRGVRLVATDLNCNSDLILGGA